MASAQVSVFARDDTIFGVCEALGQDFGFDPVLLRLLFALGIFLNPAATAAAYAAGAALVALSRWLVPEPRRRSAEPAEPLPAEDAINDQARAWEELAEAA